MRTIESRTDNETEMKIMRQQKRCENRKRSGMAENTRADETFRINTKIDHDTKHL